MLVWAATHQPRLFRSPVLEALKLISLSSLQDTLISLSTAFILGTLIGLEREYRQRTAGLATATVVPILALDAGPLENGSVRFDIFRA